MKSPAFLLLAAVALALPARADEPKTIRAGIIGLDTSHVVAFTTTLNKGPKKPEDAEKVAGVKIVAAYPQGSKDIPTSTERVPEYTEKLRGMGVEICASIEEMLQKVDAVMIESNDGRVHLEQLRPVLAAHKPCFMDKPIAGSLADAIRMLELVKESKVPFFCSSSLRFSKSTQAVHNGSIDAVQSAETFSPAHLEATHPDLYWYGVHGCEALYAVMGTGCQSVQRGTTEDGKIMVTGHWSGGRTGIFREENGKDRKGYGGKAVGAKNEEAPIGAYDNYDVLLFAIIDMFRTGKVPVPPEETLELYTFMEAADESKRRGGAEVKLADVLAKARAEVRGK